MCPKNQKNVQMEWGIVFFQFFDVVFQSGSYKLSFLQIGSVVGKKLIFFKSQV